MTIKICIKASERIFEFKKDKYVFQFGIRVPLESQLHVYLQHTSLYYYSILIPYCRVLRAQFQFLFSFCQNPKFAIFVSRIDCNCSHLFVKVFTSQTFFLYMPKNVNMMYTVKIEIQNNYSTSCLLAVYFQSTCSLLPVYFQSIFSLLPVYFQFAFFYLIQQPYYK